LYKSRIDLLSRDDLARVANDHVVVDVIIQSSVIPVAAPIGLVNTKGANSTLVRWLSRN
jgi:hypothetical protein